VTATDDSVPEHPNLLADIGRPWLTSDGAHPAADRPRRTTVLASTHRRLPQCSARTLQGGADVCGDAGPADRFPSRGDEQVLPVPGRDVPVPGSLTGQALAIGARHEPRDGTLAVTGPRSGRSRHAMLDDVAWPVGLVPVDTAGPPPLPPSGGRLPEAPGGARPGQEDPVPPGDSGAGMLGIHAGPRVAGASPVEGHRS
jgi:hypothetical protein